MPFLIEFVGVPGAGKSTLSRRVALTLSDIKGLSIREPIYVINERSPAVFRGLTKLPHAVYGAACEIMLGGRPEMYDLCTSTWSPLLNWLFVRGILEWNTVNNYITILDQGLIQGLWSFRLSERDPVVSCVHERLLAVYPAIPSLIVCVEVSPETARSRLANREDNQSRVQVGSETSFGLGQAFEAYDYIMSVIDEVVYSNDEARKIIIKNNNQEDISTNVKSIVRELEARGNYTSN